MIIDARQAHSINDLYRAYTLRLALWEGISPLLPGQTLTIDSALGADGQQITPRNLQIAIAQVIPPDWKVFTQREGDAVVIYRWS